MHEYLVKHYMSEIQLTREVLYVWTMPWAELSENFSFGQIKFWNFYKHAASNVPDSQEMLWLTKTMSCFKDRHDQAITNISVVQNGDIPFEGHSPEGNSKIIWAGNAIAFAHLSASALQRLKTNPENYGIGSSDRFELNHVLIDEDEMLTYSGNNAEGTAYLFGNLPTFREPPHIGLKMEYLDTVLLEGLSALNDKQQDTLPWRKLEVCFEWFALAWSSSPSVSHPARFIALMTAFESLVKVDREGKYDMAFKASALCNWDALPTTETIVLNKIDRDVNKAIKFISDYADHRNAFAHGSSLEHGRIRHIVGEHKYDPRLTMSAVIYAIVLALLLEQEVWGEFESQIVQSEMQDIVETLKWSTDLKVG